MSDIGDFYFDAQTRHDHYVERFKTGEYNRLLPFLRRIEEDIISRLSRSNTFRSQQRMNELLKAIQSDINVILTEYSDQLELTLNEFAVAESEFAVKTLDKAGDFNTVAPTPNQVIAAVRSRPFNNRFLRDVLKDFPKEQARLIKNAIAMGFVEGKTNQQIISEVVGTSELNYKDGAMQLTRTSASRMVRTAIQHTAAVAQQEMFKANSDLIEYYGWVSTLDGRTSPTCKKRDQQVYKVGKGALPPAHPNCRSAIIPAFKEDIYKDDDGVERVQLPGATRASRGSEGGKKVSAKLTYNEWLKRQPKSFQIEALGRAKAELFRKGGLSVNQFVDRQDKPLTLDELKAKYPTAWEKAGLD